MRGRGGGRVRGRDRGRCVHVLQVHLLRRDTIQLVLSLTWLDEEYDNPRRSTSVSAGSTSSLGRRSSLGTKIKSGLGRLVSRSPTKDLQVRLDGTGKAVSFFQWNLNVCVVAMQAVYGR